MLCNFFPWAEMEPFFIKCGNFGTVPRVTYTVLSAVVPFRALHTIDENGLASTTAVMERSGVRMSLCKAFVLLTCLGTIAGFTGCGGHSGSPPLIQPTKPSGVLFLAPPPTSLAINASATLAAAATFPITAEIGNNLVTWSMTCGSPNACGSFSTNADLNGITYTAPAAIPAGMKVTVTAASVADPTKSISATITITAPIPISVTFFGTLPASLQVNATASLHAAIANDVSANPQVKWTVSCGTAGCGSFSATSTTSEGETDFTAPAAIPSGGDVTVTATSITDPTKSASAGIVITAASATLANGTYVFQLSSGSTGRQANVITGIFVASNGAITGGEQDMTYFTSDADNNLSPYAAFEQISGGSYATTPDGNLQISITAPVSGGETLNGTLAAGGHGFIAGLNGTPANGTLDLQTNMAAPSGGYAVALSGGDPYAGPEWIGGILNIDSAGGISGNGSILDVIDSLPGYGTGGPHSVGASTVSAPDANGRLQIQLQPAGSSPLPTLNLAGYIIDATRIRLTSVADTSGYLNQQGVLGGTALGQGGNTGHFSTASLADSSYVFGAQGSDTQQVLQIAGVLSLKADGTVTGMLNWNDQTGSSAQTPIPFAGSYAVDPTGRVTLSNLTDGSTFHYSQYFYLTGDGNGLVLSNDSDDVFAGQAFQRQTAAFTAASFSGSYGLNAAQFSMNSPFNDQQTATAIGSVTAVTSSAAVSVNGFADNGNGAADFALTGSFTSNANGIFEGTLAGFDPASRSTAANFTLYLVDGTQGVLIETDNKTLTLGRLQNLQ
jgi:hypothetical protein